MCIASIAKLSNQIIITHNRDENIHRKYKEGIQNRILNGVKIQYLEDIPSKGSWIADSEKYSVCILNGAEEYTPHKINMPKSRGDIIFNLFNFSSFEDFLNSGFEGYAPFTLLVYQKSEQKTTLIFWDKETLKNIELSSEANHIRLSNTLYHPKKQEKVKGSFLNSHFHKSDDILRWHQDNAMQLGEVDSEIMAVCISQIVIDLSTHTADFRYFNLY